MKKRVAFYTLGCRLNQAETNVIAHTFPNANYDVVSIKQPADIVIINTCTVTEHGDTNTRRLVNRVNRLNPSVKIALVGCQSQVQKDKLALLPNVRWVIGNAEKLAIEKIIREQERETTYVSAPPIPRQSFTVPVTAGDARHTRPNLKIQDGCDFFCSFCEIPYARGRARSREFDDIIKEAKAFVSAGHKEIVLTGINLGVYRYKGKTLLDIIDALEQIEGLARIRISSIEPTTIDIRLIKRMRKEGKLCRYLHIPLQSASDTLLLAMKRRYTAKEFADFIKRVVDLVPEVCVGSDVIVGFPGETDAFFMQTYAFIRDLPLTYLHVFRYSERHNAKSRHLKGKVPIPTMKKRSKLLRDLTVRKKKAFLTRLVGTKQFVLFERRRGEQWVGLTDNYVRVKVKADKELRNQMHCVKLTAVDNDMIRGDLAS